MIKGIKKLISLKEINDLAIAENVHKGHPGNMHLWWNRSPIDASEALLKEVVWDASDIDKNGVGYPTICDPFSGFGGLTIAAQRLGMKVQAGDLNSVATLLTKAATEIPARFAECSAVNPLNSTILNTGAKGLADDVKYYGNWLINNVKEKLSDFYPEATIDGEKQQVYSWIWVRTMKCPNPACNCEMPLASSYVLSKLKGHEYWVEPIYKDSKLFFQIHQGECPPDRCTNKHGSKGSRFQCPVCGGLTKDEQVKKAGISHQLGIRLMAVSLPTKYGRTFILPDEINMNAANASIPEKLPTGSIAINSRWFSPPLYGLTEYTDLYTPRQLCLMTELCNVIPETLAMVKKDAIAAGFKLDNNELADGGKGALAYSQAVCVYLALLISRLANYSSAFCTWDNRKGNIRATITRQAITMAWVFAEGNPFSGVTGNINTLLKNIYESVRALCTIGEVTVNQNNALKMEYPENSILFTELPYYDNVGYADLSDYFYIWLRMCLRDIYPALFESVVTSKEELSSIPEHYNGNTVEAIKQYRIGVNQLFKKFYPAASEEYSSIIFYEFCKTDILAIAEDIQLDDMSPLEYLLDCLNDNGFCITGIWPVRSEKLSDNFETFRIAVVFSKRKQLIHVVTRRNFVALLKKELPAILATIYQDDIDERDMLVSGIGKGLGIFTGYGKVINADGSNMSMHDALQIIYIEVNNYINQRNNEKINEGD